jgi:DNA polymerase-3 subunit epsilon
VSSLGTPAFAVLDLETTGFSPRRGHRVIELAIVRLNRLLEVLDEYHTLVNPGRPAGAVCVHGLSEADLVTAPAFLDIAGDVAIRLRGTVIVGHNLRFDIDFLTAEFERFELKAPSLVSLCTLDLAFLLEPNAPVRKLEDCCRRAGITPAAHHDALEDARATARLLDAYRRLAQDRGITKAQELFDLAIAFPKEEWRDFPAPSGRRLSREDASAIRMAHQHYLARLVERLPGDEASSPAEAAYLHLIDKALEDRQLSPDETEALIAEAERLGLSVSQAHGCHHSYLRALVRSAQVDGVITEAERHELHTVATMLGVGAAALKALLPPA